MESRRDDRTIESHFNESTQISVRKEKICSFGESAYSIHMEWWVDIIVTRLILHKREEEES